MSDYIERMKIERHELKDKLDKLDVFISSDSFDKLDKRNRHLLVEQSTYMLNYLKTLDARLWLAHGNW